MENGGAREHIPETIGRYEIHECIGVGAMGAVYKAFDPLIKRTLAIKTIRLDVPRQSPQYQSFIERFYHEARVSGTLSHPNIVTLFDIGDDAGLPFLAMELVDGETLAELIEQGTHFSPEDVVRLVSQIAAAIDHAHAKGVIHRDIKPSNLILFEADKVKVTDFGIAKLVDAKMTQQGQLLGTPSYMSPEQAMGEDVDQRTDIFSLGVCAFEMISGEQPFPGNNVTAILYKLVHVDPIEPSTLEMSGVVPDRWHAVFSKVLAKAPEDRYVTATDFVRGLEQCLQVGSLHPAAATLRMARPAPDRDATRTMIPDPPTPLPPQPPSRHRTPQPAPEPAGESNMKVATEAEPFDPAVLLQSAEISMPAQPASPTLPGPAPPPVEETVLLPAAGVQAQTGARAAAPLPETTVQLSTQSPAVSAGSAPEAAEETVLLDVRPPVEPTVLLSPPAAAVASVSQPVPVGETVLVKLLGDPHAPERRPASAGQLAPVEKTVLMEQPAATVRAPRPRSATPAAKPGVGAPGEAPGVPVAAWPAPFAGKGRSMAWVLGGAAAGFLLVAGIALVLRGDGGESPSAASAAASTPPPSLATPKPVIHEGVLQIESEPAGLMVTVNGEERGPTPLLLKGMAIGNYEVRIEAKDYELFSQLVAVTNAEPVQVWAELTQRRAAVRHGALLVTSTPAEAGVRVDSRSVGSTPLKPVRLKPGRHRVEVAKAGHESWSHQVTVVAGKTAKVSVTLKPLATPSFTLPTPEPGRVYANRLSEVDEPARKIKGRTASYPRKAPDMRSGESVSVRISFVVTEEGRVVDVDIMESGGEIVDQEVKQAVKRWKYKPAVKYGAKVKVRIEFKQTFRKG